MKSMSGSLELVWRASPFPSNARAGPQTSLEHMVQSDQAFHCHVHDLNAPKTVYLSNMASSRQFPFTSAQYFRPKPPSLKIREEISRGAYGSVHYGELDGRPVAVKRIHRLLLEAARGQGDFEQVMTDFKRECQLLEKLHHPHVVDFRGAFYDETTDEPMLVMERMRENLRKFLERK